MAWKLPRPVSCFLKQKSDRGFPFSDRSPEFFNRCEGLLPECSSLVIADLLTQDGNLHLTKVIRLS